MDDSQKKQQISVAFIHAVAAHAGFKLSYEIVDDDSIDVTIAASGYVRPTSNIRSPRIGLQLKCTSQKCITNDSVKFPLHIKNRNDLCRKSHLPSYLVVLVLPFEPEHWLDHNEERMISNGGAYYLSLEGWELSANKTKETVLIPRRQLFNKDSLEELLYIASKEKHA